jgi:hypothetical protein
LASGIVLWPWGNSCAAPVSTAAGRLEDEISALVDEANPSLATSLPLADSVGAVCATADSVCERVEDRLACSDWGLVAVEAWTFAEADARAAWLVVE